MLENIRSLISEALTERDKSQAVLDAIIEAADAEGRSEMSADEVTRFDAARAEVRTADEKLTELRQRESDLVEIEARKAEAAEVRREVGATPTVTVKSEERTYRKDQGGSDAFLSDAYSAHFRRGDYRGAEERLERSQRENAAELRSTTGAFGGLVVPQYLVSDFAPIAVSGRPFINAIRHEPLPADGMTMNIPRGSTATQILNQTNQGDTVANVTYAVSDVVVNINTYAGQNVFSRQAFERGYGIGSVVLSDLYQQYATKTNVDALGGAGTSGTHKGVFSITTGSTALTSTSISLTTTGATSAQAVAAQKLIKAIGLVNERRYMPADLIVMHPRRWAWLIGGIDTQNRPLVDVAGAALNTWAEGHAAAYGVVGSFAGVPVITDGGISTAAGVSTDQDTILVTRRDDNIFWEAAGAPIGITFEEVLGDKLQVRVVAFGYSAYTGERYPTAHVTVTGTGLTWLL